MNKCWPKLLSWSDKQIPTHYLLGLVLLVVLGDALLDLLQMSRQGIDRGGEELMDVIGGVIADVAGRGLDALEIGFDLCLDIRHGVFSKGGRLQEPQGYDFS